MCRQYQSHELSKREQEVVNFLQTGSDNFWDAYSNYNARKKRMDRPTQTIASWFNSTLKGLHSKRLFEDIAYVLSYRTAKGMMFVWANPGINASKANYQAITLHDATLEMKKEISKII